MSKIKVFVSGKYRANMFGIMIDTANRICYIGNSIRTDSCPVFVFQKVFYSIIQSFYFLIFSREQEKSKDMRAVFCVPFCPFCCFLFYHSLIIVISYSF